MSTALYRRYRPETFAEVIGQSHVTDPLSAAIDSGRINHAYLFSGPRGCGKTTSARILARCLNCAEGPTSNPCGECPSCRDLANGGAGSLDVVEIDAASHNGVDDARDLRERAVYAPARDRYKVFILDEAHMVTTQGFNALLKLVEEPPDHVKFVFATTEPEKVIGTIRSRTHHYPFRLVPPEILTAYLEDLCGRESVPVGRGVLPLVVRAGGGSVRDTLSVLDQLMAGAGADGIDYETAVALLGYTHDSLLGDIVDAFSAGDGGGVFRVIDRVVESGHDPRRFVEDLLERFRDLIVIAAAPEEAASFLPEVPADRLERLRIQARSLGQAELSRAADLLNAGLSEMSGATSPRLHLELICARILLPAADGERRSVVSRVERMERRIGMSPTGVVPAGAVAPAPAEPSADQQAPAAERGGRGAASAAQGAGCAEPRGDQQSGRPSGGAPQRPGSTAQQAADPYDGMAEAMASAASVLSGGDSGRPASQPASAEAAAEPTAAEAQSSAPAQSQAPSQEAAPQRPSAPRQSSTPPSAPDGPSGAQPQPQQQPQPQAERAPAAGAAQAAPSDGAPQAAHSGGAEIDAIRRGWPDVLGRLQQLRRLSHAIVSANAFPQRFDAGVLYLGFSNPGSVQAFLRGPHAQMLSSALDDALGIAARIEVGDDSAGPIPDLGGERRGGRGADQPQRRQPPAPRQPSQQEMDAVVGPRQADRPPVDHERFWQSDDAPSGPWADDDAEGDSPSASVTPPDPGPAPAAAEPQRSGQAEDAQPVQDGAAQAGRDDAAQSVRDDAVPPVRDDAAQPVRDDSAPHAESETSAGEGAVDAYALMVPPPEDDDDDVVPVDDEWIPDGARGVGPEPAERAEFSGAPEDALDGYAEPTDPVAPADDDPQDAVDAPVGAGGPDADGAQPPQGAGQAAAVDDLLGAYADIDIAFTDNPGFEQPAAASDGPGQPDPRGRFAHIAERHRNDPDPTGGAATAPAPTPEPEPDPIENYAEYDTEGDLDLGEAPEFGPAVVERLLGGVIIEESRG